MSSRDVHVTSSIHTEHPSLDQPNLVVDWPFYITLMLRIMWLVKNLLLLIAEDIEVGSFDSGNYKDEIVTKWPFKILNGAISYLISNAKQAFIQLRQAFNKSPIF